MAKFVMTAKQALIEELGDIDEQMKALQERAKEIRAKLAKREGKFNGVHFYATVFERPTSSLVVAKVKRLLGPAKYATCVKHGTAKVVKIARID